MACEECGKEYQHYICPQCGKIFPEMSCWTCIRRKGIFSYTHRCDICGIEFFMCGKCGTLSSKVAWEHLSGGPEVYAICENCHVSLPNTPPLVTKASLYNEFRYAFKFVNREHIPYPQYFVGNGNLVIGTIERDLGEFVNDFFYRMAGASPDRGTSRGYQVKTEITDEQCAVITHESGLEVFLLGVAGFVTAKTGEFVLTRILEAIERRINARFSSHPYSRQVKGSEEFVEKILVRTPNWEIAVDGRFSASERKELFDHLGDILEPPSKIVDVTAGLTKQSLRNKVEEASKQVISEADLDIVILPEIGRVIQHGDLLRLQNALESEIAGETLILDLCHEPKEGIRIGASNIADKELARDRILTLRTDPPVELPCPYIGKVVNTTEDGVIIEILPGTRGLIPISNLSWSRKIDYDEFYKPGMLVRATTEDIDKQGSVTLTTDW